MFHARFWVPLSRAPASVVLPFFYSCMIPPRHISPRPYLDFACVANKKLHADPSSIFLSPRSHFISQPNFLAAHHPDSAHSPSPHRTARAKESFSHGRGGCGGGTTPRSNDGAINFVHGLRANKILELVCKSFSPWCNLQNTWRC